MVSAILPHPQLGHLGGRAMHIMTCSAGASASGEDEGTSESEDGEEEARTTSEAGPGEGLPGHSFVSRSPQTANLDKWGI